MLSQQDHITSSQFFTLSSPGFDFLYTLLSENNNLSDLQELHREVYQPNNQHLTLTILTALHILKVNHFCKEIDIKIFFVSRTSIKHRQMILRVFKNIKLALC